MKENENNELSSMAGADDYQRLSEKEISDVWDSMPGQPNGFYKSFGYSQFAHAIEDKVASRFRAQGGITNKESVGSAVSTAVGETVAWLYEYIGKDGPRKKGELVARTVSELSGNIDLHSESWKRLSALAPIPPVSAAEQPDDLPRLPAPTRLHYGLHYRADDMEAYARDAVDMALARQSQAKPVEQLRIAAEVERIADYWEDQARRGCVDAFQCAIKEALNAGARLAAPTQVSAPQAVPEVLLNAKAVYDELYKTSYCSSLEEVSDVLDAIVRLIRADAPQASAAQEVRAVPVGYARQSELDKLADGRVAGVGMMIHKEPGDGKVALYLEPTSTSTAPAAMDEKGGTV